jgi:CubicO group peptidase (beta-lactamase class C family)
VSAPEGLRRDLDRILGEAQAARLPSVAAAVVRRGELVWSGAVGVADAEAEREATPETQYRIGSITKTFTTVAVLQLREEGTLALDDPLERHLPEVGDGRPTLRTLLSHLSGLQREPVGEMWETLESPSVEQLLAQLPQAERVLEPYTRHHYSNLGFALLGEVVARRSGRPYREHVDERILRPLGLSRTTWDPQEPYAQGYFVDPYANVLHREQHPDLAGVSSAGQLWSTTGDLCRWAAFLAEGRDDVLPRAAVERLWFPHGMWDPDAWTLAWGIGLMLYRRGDRIFGGHGGAMAGHLAGVYVDRKSGIGAAALTNSSAAADMDGLAIRLAEAAIGALPEPPKPWRPQPGPPEELAGALGVWWSEGAEFVFFWEDGALRSRLAAPKREQPPAVFERVGDDLYRTVSGREEGELLRLVRDEQGAVVRMYWATYPFSRTPEVFGAAR